ncbi:hypothetical protein IE53DRAFT_372275 [Violaceomyces palustris]|uniref:Uncharacterized protein n=1 Tax=Violaceomyces palustris TaxID=1673888 RepID=A0ACD0NL43_9BASI|nr:hypothetical protein IE53DRAFT_372275 [Violaceomyces palustris]
MLQMGTREGSSKGGEEADALGEVLSGGVVSIRKQGKNKPKEVCSVGVKSQGSNEGAPPDTPWG